MEWSDDVGDVLVSRAFGVDERVYEYYDISINCVA